MLIEYLLRFFDRPWFLLLLAVIPVVWVMSYRSLAGLGNARRMIALVLRTSVLLLIVFALAEFQWVKTSNRLTVIYLLDQSASIPSEKRALMMKYVVEEVRRHRNADREDRAGIVIFGRDAMIEIPPFDDDIPSTSRLAAELGRRDATNLEAALKLAQASFPEDSAKRIVVVTDGNENLGNARAITPLLADNGIGIDVVPVRLTTRAEVIVEKVALPSDIRRGQSFETRIVLNNYSEGDQSGPVKGRLRILRRAGNKEELVGDELPVTLDPGKTVVTLKDTIDKPAMYTYRAQFAPDDPDDDLMAENNEATAFTHVRGRGRVLLIEDSANPGEFDYLVERLRAMNIEIDVQGTNQLFTSLAELQGYDSVILAGVPRSNGEDANEIFSFSDEQIQMLVRNTEQMGAGLIMIGGPNSFGAGGWINTELEKAMPVDFQIKNQKIQAVGALALMMHASEMAQGNHWQKVVAREAIKALGDMDYCGLLHWDNFAGDAWLWGGRQGMVRVSGQRDMMLARLNRMSPGDMPEFEPSMKMALRGFKSVNASVKHMIIISDGDPSPPFNTTIAAFKAEGIKISTVAVGTHGPAGSTPLQNIATATGGRYYVVTNPKALPKIYQREARRVARPLVKDLDNIPPDLLYGHQITEGIDGPLPPLTGFVLTTLKENPLVEVAMRSPVPNEPRNSTVLAAWNYGLGRSVVFTTDAGHRWANAWTDWENYDKFFSQMVRWSMRPVTDENKFTVATDVRDGKVRIVITALDKDDELLDFLDLQGAAVSPELDTLPVPIRQEAPGRYVGEFDADQAGSYHVTLSPGPGQAPILAGVNVPYSAEFREREANIALLRALAAERPDGGKSTGRVIGDDLNEQSLDELLAVDTFRHDLARATTSQDVWHLVLLISACIFFADVFVRRVSLGYEWIEPAVNYVRQRLARGGEATQVEQSLERLRSQKAAVADSIDQRRAAARFDPQVDEELGFRKDLDEVIGEVSGGAAETPRQAPTRPQMTPGTADEDYTARLLKAKKRAWDEKKKE